MLPSIARSILRDHQVPVLSAARFLSNNYKRNEAMGALTEDDLHRTLMKSPPPPFTRLAAHEWQSKSGVGDMVFEDPKTNRFLVVEAKLLRGSKPKYIKQKWDKVQEQAGRYGRDWKIKHPSAFVKYATFTNRDGLLPLGELP